YRRTALFVFRRRDNAGRLVQSDIDFFLGANPRSIQMDDVFLFDPEVRVLDHSSVDLDAALLDPGSRHRAGCDSGLGKDAIQRGARFLHGVMPITESIRPARSPSRR